MTDNRIELRATCIASTDESLSGAASHAASNKQKLRHHNEQNNYFREAQFTPDGSTIITLSGDKCLRSFELLRNEQQDNEQSFTLKPLDTYNPPSNIQSYAVHPLYNRENAATTVVLTAVADQPLALRNTLKFSHVPAKFNNISPTTEEYYTTNSLCFTRDNWHFIAGGKNRLSVYDCIVDHPEPVLTHKLSPGAKARRRYGESGLTCKGIATALSVNVNGTLAVGTTQREVGLFSDDGLGQPLTSFSVASGLSDMIPNSGTGIMHLKWSADGVYLLVAERQSDCVQVFDVRSMVRQVSVLSGRRAITTQRMGVDLVQRPTGCQLWAGGTDGVVRMWNNPGQFEGELKPDAELKLHTGEHSTLDHRTMVG
jgi:telomerase Cajal body protein 1